MAMMWYSIPICITRADQHRCIHDRENVDFINNMLVDNAIWSTQSLSKSFIIRRQGPKAFFRYFITDFWKRRQETNCVSEFLVPSVGDFRRLFAENMTDNFHPLAMCVIRPLYFHHYALVEFSSAIIFSISLNDSSSERNSPFSNSLRETSIMRLRAARLRQFSISFHVFSKSATLIITLVLRPFCVMTIGRCVRAVRKKQSLSVLRYSVNEMTSSSRRGLNSGFADAVITYVPLNLKSSFIVQYSVPVVKWVHKEFKEVA